MQAHFKSSIYRLPDIDKEVADGFENGQVSSILW